MDNREIHEAELKIAKYFIDICKENNLEYFILGGTFLGAVRHKGFIPWDDDMDFGMPRSDYERLYTILNSKQSERYVFKNFKNSNIKTYFSRIEDPEFQILDNSAKVQDIRAAWIDIFPMDGVPNQPLKRKIHELRVLSARLLLQYSQFDEIVNQNLPGRKKYEQLLIDIGNVIKPQRFLDTRNAFERVDNLLKKYSYEDSDYVGNHMGAYKFNETFSKKLYMDIKEYPFENMKFRAPADFDTILSQLYGDYMTPPKDEDKNKHHTETNIKSKNLIDE
ncbi:LicD family protein [Enterococcus asini]|uniref:LicD family protein n=1 Tax=Enterococcus asini TaxID=57732 RepID=UPI0032E4F556